MSNFRVMDIEDCSVSDFVSIEVDRVAISNGLFIAIGNAKERIELLNDQILERSYGDVSWVDGRDGEGMIQELDALMAELRTQIIAKGVLVTIYNAL